jgi:cyclophilin family peptidyl-prolyl cis-trans isomerase
MKFRRSSNRRPQQLKRRILKLEGLEPRHMMSASVDMLSTALDAADDDATPAAVADADDDAVAPAAQATLAPIDNVKVPGRKSVLVPLTGFDPDGQPITYEFESNNLSVLFAKMAGTTSVRFNVSGVDKDGVAFTGTLVFRLFEDVAPQTTARIKQLVTEGFYSNKPFHRIIDGFMAQAGTNSGTDIADEFNSAMTFVSRGLLAMANAGDDTGDSQFFVTATNADGSSNPIDLADMPQHLNYQHTIFGQLVAGFDVFEKLMQVNVEANPNTPNNEVSRPVSPVTITSAEVFTDTQNAVLRIFATSGFTGDATVTVRARTTTGEVTTQTFTATGVADTRTEPPFLGPVANQTANAGSPVTFTLTATDFSGNAGKVYAIFDATTGQAPNSSHLTVSINQQTGQVTLTPSATAPSTMRLLAGVRATAAGTSALNHDTQEFTLTVTNATGVAAPTGLAAVPPTSGGPFDDAGFVTSATPTITVNAVAGATVRIKRGGTVIATATETATGSGVYRATLPAGTLAVGANSLTAAATTSAGTGPDSTALSLTYAPDYSLGVYVVPGAAGVAQSLTVAWTSKNAAYNNEFGYAVVSSADGTIGGVAPSAANYAQALLSSSTRRVLFAKGAGAGATANVSLNGGQFIVFYMIQNNTTANFLASNPSNAMSGNNNSRAPLAFFSVAAANPDDNKHAQVISADPTTGFIQYNWEDLVHLGDGDFNDAAITIRTAAQTVAAPAGVRAPGSTGNVRLNGTLRPGSQSSPLGDVGVFFVDNPSGAIGSLQPGSAGYAQAALAAANSAVLFPVGATGARSVTAPAGKYVAFYSITSGTTANFRTVNPSNSSTGSVHAMFSFDDANVDDANHFRWVTPGSQEANPNATQLHVNSTMGSGANGFDAYTIDLAFAE